MLPMWGKFLIGYLLLVISKNMRNRLLLELRKNAKRYVRFSDK